MCYIDYMTRVASRELRNETRRLLERVESGEDIVITVDGRDVAVLKPVAGRRRWVDGRSFFERLARTQADASLQHELDELLPDTTDDIRDPW